MKSFKGFCFAALIVVAVATYLVSEKSAVAPSSRSGAAGSASSGATAGGMSTSGLPVPRGMSLAGELIKFPEPSSAMVRRLGHTEEEEAHRAALIADGKNLDGARDYLLNEHPTWEFDKLLRRQSALDLLALAVASKNNPGRDHAIKAISKVLLTDDYDRWKDPADLTVALGDRAYLFLTLLKYEPSKADEVYRRAKGTRMAMVFDRAKNDFTKARKGS